jgi:hypothetical protein
MIEIILGLPHMRQGPILARALALKAPLLISANALSRWRGQGERRRWQNWNLSTLGNLPAGTDLTLDSGGFTCHVTYGGFPWTIDAYVELAASYPFRHFASFDYPVEQEIAADRTAIDERLSRTVAANRETRRRARDAGIEHRFMPVLQGRSPDDYERCADALCWSIEAGRTIGVGSMCRREVRGPEGLVAVVERLDRILPPGVRLHCFGVKGTALRYLAEFGTRVASIDSQAYGVGCRRDAYRRGISKTDTLVARHMSTWLRRQRREALLPARQLRPEAEKPKPRPSSDPWEQAIATARAEINALIEEGQLDHDELIEPWIEQWAADLYRHAA